MAVSLNKENLYASAKAMQARIQGVLPSISSDPEFLRRGGIVYPYSTIDANLDPIFLLLEQAGRSDLVLSPPGGSVIDIGCANGDIALMFADMGVDVAAVDYSYSHDQAPYIVSRMSERLSVPMTVVDMSIDTHFDMNSLRQSRVHTSRDVLSSKKDRFGLAIVVGLLYHLRNPFAFLESLAGVSDYCVLGTHLFTHLSENMASLADWPLAYLVDEGELNNDPTNYWIFNDRAMTRTLRRSGFNIVARRLVSNNPDGIGLPHTTDLGVRGFYLLESARASLHCSQVSNTV